MRIKEVAKRTGLTEKTIRYYESVGLVVPDMEMKDHRVWRDYNEKHARLLSVVATLRRASFRVEEIALLLTSPEKIPETVEKVYQRVEATRAEAEKLCARLAQPDLREAPDVMALARQLEGTASGFELPPADRSYDYRSQERKVAEPRSLAGALALRLGALLLAFWAVAVFTALCLLAGYVREQTLPVVTETLEGWLAGLPEDGSAALSLPEIELTPDYESRISKCWLGVGGATYVYYPSSGSFPPVARMPLLVVQRAVLTVDRSGTVRKNDGFYINKYQPYITALTVNKNTLSGISVEAGLLPVPLTFHSFSLRSGSFPMWEDSRDLSSDKALVQAAQLRQTPLKLLDGIESGEYRFDSRYLWQTAVLRGRWLRNEAGEPETFVMAAYGWSPLRAAAKAIRPFALGLLAFFLLLGALVWLGLHRSLIRPLERLGAALTEAPLAADPAEFDYSFRWRELRDVTAAYLLRHQMQEASAVQPAKAADLTGAMEEARRKLLPMIGARRLDPVADYRAEGAVAAGPEALENALLALIQEALPYGEQDEKLTLRTMEKEDFLLAEAEVRTKWFLRSGAYAALWEGVYRLPADSEAPGARLRKASAAIPGSFCAVRKTKHGLVLTLGLQKAE